MRFVGCGHTVAAVEDRAYRRVVLGLGSNLGDRTSTILSAVSRLCSSIAPLTYKCSALYETLPVGGPPQGNYLNAAIVLQTNLAGPDILAVAMAVEQAHGRIRRERNGPRTLDIDVLWIEAEVIDSPSLTVPHPRLLERPFALVPLLDVAPDAVDPRSGLAIASNLEALRLEGVCQVAPAPCCGPPHGREGYP